MDYKKFLLFGDSITEYAFDPEHFTVGSALTNAYTRKLDIIQRGYAGYNSRWAIRILEKIIEQHGNDIVIGTIFFGSNDSVEKGPQRVPLPEFVNNIKKMIGMMKQANIKPIVVGPGLIDRDVWDVLKSEEIEKGWIRTNQFFKEYVDALIDLTKDENVPFVNLQQSFLEISEANNEKWQKYLIDGLHFSGDGYRIFFERLMEMIELYYPEYSPDNMNTILPNWRDIKADGSNISL